MTIQPTTNTPPSMVIKAVVDKLHKISFIKGHYMIWNLIGTIGDKVLDIVDDVVENKDEAIANARGRASCGRIAL